jgi:hypothetical protein
MKADFGLNARRNLDYEELHVIHRKKARKGMKEVWSDIRKEMSGIYIYILENGGFF